jgi:hypothetical protein
MKSNPKVTIDPTATEAAKRAIMILLLESL